MQKEGLSQAESYLTLIAPVQLQCLILVNSWKHVFIWNNPYTFRSNTSQQIIYSSKMTVIRRKRLSYGSKSLTKVSLENFQYLARSSFIPLHFYSHPDDGITLRDLEKLTSIHVWRFSFIVSQSNFKNPHKDWRKRRKKFCLGASK